MRADYPDWLHAQGYAGKTASSRLAELTRVETEYGSVESCVASGGYNALLDHLAYSTEDARQDRPNPSRFVIDGDLRSNLASYRAALRLYKRFLDMQPGR